MAKGYQWRSEREWERIAWLASNLMNASGNLKKPVSPNQLLGRGIKAKEDRRSKEEKAADLFSLEKEIEAKRKKVDG